MAEQFRKRPVVITAEQWFPGVPVAGVIEGSYVSGDEQCYPAKCPTLEGVFGVTPGDWIITGVKGERYPIKPDIFAETYDPVAATPPPKHTIRLSFPVPTAQVLRPVPGIDYWHLVVELDGETVLVPILTADHAEYAVLYIAVDGEVTARSSAVNAAHHAVPLETVTAHDARYTELRQQHQAQMARVQATLREPRRG